MTAFVTHLAERGVSASTQNQALSAILFLFEVVIGQRLAWMNEIVRAQRPVRLPVVLSRSEVVGAALAAAGTGMADGVADVWGGTAAARMRRASGERHQLRSRRVDHAGREGRQGSGDDAAGRAEGTAAGSSEAREGSARGGPCGRTRCVALPGALRAKYPNAPNEWAWQWVFPATRFYVDQETGERRRHHLHESVLQRAVKDAARAAGVSPPCHVSFAAAFVCDAFARSRVRHPDDSGTARASRREHDDDLHARVEPGRARRAKSARSTGARLRAGGDFVMLQLQVGIIVAIEFGLSRVACGTTRTPTVNAGNTSRCIQPGTSSRYTASFVCVMGYRVRPTIR